MESEKKNNQRVQQALEHIDKGRLILAPDCGLSFLPKKQVLWLRWEKKVCRALLRLWI